MSENKDEDDERYSNLQQQDKDDNNSDTDTDTDTDKEMMWAVVTMGNGGYDQLQYKRIPKPVPGLGEVLVQVLAAGVNNTDINTRVGWYSSSFRTSTADADAAIATATLSSTTSSASTRIKDDGSGGSDGWNQKATPFPLIQGTDACGKVVSAGEGVDISHFQKTKRVLIRPCIRAKADFASLDNNTIWMASDFDGAFAQFVKVPFTEVFPVDCPSWTDAELATIPCAYGTAENMLHRANVTAADHVLVTGASGGVGSATIQLAKRRGARVTALCRSSNSSSSSNNSNSDDNNKLQQVQQQTGADCVLIAPPNGPDFRNLLLKAIRCHPPVTVIVDNVAGSAFPALLKVLQQGGRYVTSGAIAGPHVELDFRDLYLQDKTLIGCTAWDESVFPNLISHMERGEIHPILAQSFALQDIVQAQQEFLKKQHIGKFVLIIPPPSV